MEDTFFKCNNTMHYSFYLDRTPTEPPRPTTDPWTTVTPTSPTTEPPVTPTDPHSDGPIPLTTEVIPSEEPTDDDSSELAVNVDLKLKLRKKLHF